MSKPNEGRENDSRESVCDTQTLIAMADPNENKPDGTIMLIDDEDMVANATKRVLVKILRIEEEKITVCASVRSAITRIEGGQSPSAIISDVNMPVEAGDAFYEYLKNRPQLIPRLLFITGGGSGSESLEEFIDKMLQRGRCLEKPFKMKDLAYKINEILGQSPKE
jgi:CheY-like chemotaxis protein